jgi:glycosyltransferase involved in cell wall biosynthesis
MLLKGCQKENIIVDAREFISGRQTGIGRFISGLINALAEKKQDVNILLACYCKYSVPHMLKDRRNIFIRPIPSSFIGSERLLSNVTKNNTKLFLSPYPKLPLFGINCPSIHVIHDVFYITHRDGRKLFKAIFDKLRLKLALKRADMTWYDSSFSLKETEKLIGYPGKNPRVRHLAIDDKFCGVSEFEVKEVLKKNNLDKGYILAVGNGLPHKNLGVLMRLTRRLSRLIVFAGVSKPNQHHWQALYPNANVKWIAQTKDSDLPALIKGAFCLAQPSKLEGYGYPPLEAMACGIPTVVSDIPVLVETAGNHALTADPENSASWQCEFNKLEDRNFRNRVIDDGLKWVAPLRGHKGWDKHISDIEELLTCD